MRQVLLTVVATTIALIGILLFMVLCLVEFVLKVSLDLLNAGEDRLYELVAKLSGIFRAVGQAGKTPTHASENTTRHGGDDACFKSKGQRGNSIDGHANGPNDCAHGRTNQSRESSTGDSSPADGSSDTGRVVEKPTVGGSSR